MSKLLALSLVTLMSMAVHAADIDGPALFPGGPGPGHGPGPGPGGPPPGPGGPFPPGPGPGNPFPNMDSCNMAYDGVYDSGSRMRIEFRTGNFGTIATLWVDRQMWRVRANCDNRGFDFDIQGYEHSGGFSYRPWGVDGLRGTEYFAGRPLQSFAARAAH